MKTKPFIKSGKTILLIFFTLLVSLACMTTTAIPTQTTNIPSKETGVPATASADSGTPAAQSNVDFGVGPFNYPNTKAGLTDLSSYTA